MRVLSKCKWLLVTHSLKLPTASIYDLGAQATYVCMYVCKCMLQLMYLHTVRTVYISPEVTCIDCVPPYVCIIYTVYTWAGFTLSLCVPLVWLQDEWDDDETKGKLTYYFNGLPRQIEVEPDMIHNPQYSKLRLAIEWVPASSASFEHCCRVDACGVHTYVHMWT